MKTRDSRRLGSVKRGRAFGTDHHEVFDGAPDAPTMFDDLDRIGRELEDLFTQQDSNLRSTREAAKTRRQARRTVRRSAEAISGFARSLGTVGYEEKFSVPRLLDDEGLLSRARGFATEAAPIAAALVGRGMKATTLADLPAQIQSLNEAMAVQGREKASRIGARAGIEERFAKARTILDWMDTIVKRGPREDPETLSAWKNVRRIGPSRAKKAVTAPPATTPTPIQEPSKTPAA